MDLEMAYIIGMWCIIVLGVTALVAITGVAAYGAAKFTVGASQELYKSYNFYRDKDLFEIWKEQLETQGAMQDVSQAAKDLDVDTLIKCVEEKNERVPGRWAEDHIGQLARLKRYKASLRVAEAIQDKKRKQAA